MVADGETLMEGMGQMGGAFTPGSGIGRFAGVTERGRALREAARDDFALGGGMAASELVGQRAIETQAAADREAAERARVQAEREAAARERASRSAFGAAAREAQSFTPEVRVNIITQQQSRLAFSRRG
jgi:hypothetical protein